MSHLTFIRHSFVNGHCTADYAFIGLSLCLSWYFCKLQTATFSKSIVPCDSFSGIFKQSCTNY